MYLKMQFCKHVLFFYRPLSHKNRFKEGQESLQTPFKRNMSLQIGKLPSNMARCEVMNPGQLFYKNYLKFFYFNSSYICLTQLIFFGFVLFSMYLFLFICFLINSLIAVTSLSLKVLIFFLLIFSFRSFKVNFLINSCY